LPGFKRTGSLTVVRNSRTPTKEAETGAESPETSGLRTGHCRDLRVMRPEASERERERERE
jgi:hypothetical protein